MDGLTHMTLDRQNMQEAIKRIVVPEICALGFKGSLPHFRRRGDGEHQLLMLFFNKYGGSFYVEAGRVSDQRVRELQRLWEKAGNSLAESSLTVGQWFFGRSRSLVCIWTGQHRLQCLSSPTRKRLQRYRQAGSFKDQAA